MDAPVAQSLGLRSRGGMTITGGSGSASAITFADDVAFDVGGVTLKSRVAVMTLQMKYDRPLAGILGAPFFSRSTTRLDFAGSTLDVCDPDAFTPPRDAERIPFRIEEEIPMIDIGLQLPRREEIVAPVYVDTAASQAIVLNRPFVAAHRLEEGQRLEDQRAGPLTGSMSYAAVRGASVRIGSRVHTGVIVGFSPSERTNRAGVVGNGILSNYVLVLDYGRRRLYLQQRASAQRRTLLASRFMDLGDPKGRFGRNRPQQTRRRRFRG